MHIERVSECESSATTWVRVKHKSIQHLNITMIIKNSREKSQSLDHPWPFVSVRLLFIFIILYLNVWNYALAISFGSLFDETSFCVIWFSFFSPFSSNSQQWKYFRSVRLCDIFDEFVLVFWLLEVNNEFVLFLTVFVSSFRNQHDVRIVYFSYQSTDRNTVICMLPTNWDMN